AEVVRVEPPGGSLSRRAGPLAGNPGASLSFALRNAGKRGVCLDLHAEVDRGRFLDLLSRADVWLHSQPGISDDVPELEPNRVLERAPHLIVAVMSDFGLTGPHCKYLGSDMIAVATGGMLYRSGAPEKPPVAIPGSLGYDTLAVSAAVGSILAVMERNVSGRGQILDVSAQEAVANLADWSVPLYSTLGIYQHREGAGSYPIYRCRDGWVRMLIFSKKQWHTVLDWIGRPEPLLDPALEEYWGRFAARPLIDEHLGRFFQDWTKIEAAAEAQRRGLAATPLLTAAEAIDNPHTRARAGFVRREIVKGVTAAVPAGFFIIDGVRVGPRGRAPEPGEHNDEPFASEPAMSTLPESGNDLPAGNPAAAAPAGGAAASAGRAGDRRQPQDAGARSTVGSALPFEGVFAVDLGVGVAGPEVGRLLVEYGAEVVKVESSTAPDFVRTVIPGPVNAPFTSSNRGKKSLGVNLKTEEGCRLVRRLIAQADVMIENSGAGVLSRLGLDPLQLRQDNPRLIVFSTRLLGSEGPWKDWIGYGPNAHAVSGLQYLWNYPEDVDRPAGSTNIHPDHYTGRLGMLAVAAALIRRRRSGRGMHIDIAQFEVLQHLIGDILAQESITPGSAVPCGNDSPLGVPWGVYPCAGDDEWCVVNVRTRDQWQALCRCLEQSEWASDRTLDDVDNRRKRRREIDEAIERWTRVRTPMQAMAELQAAGVPAGAVEHPAMQVDDPHLAARGFFRKIEQPELGEVTVEGPCFTSRCLEPRDTGPAPLLGQHTREICAGRLGLDSREIDRLLAAGVLEQWPS
ncbi:MAG: CoA transferase, partial [Deltaproteobacteria bacterium]